MRRLVFGAEQAQFHPLDGQRGAAQDEPGEVAGAVADGVVLPLLTQLGNLGRLARDDARSGRVLAKDAALQELRWTVGVASGYQADDLDPGGQSAGNPEHPNRNHQPVLAGSEFLDELGHHRGRRIPGRQLQHLDLGVGVRAALGVQPVVEQFELGLRRHRGQHQRIVGGAEVGEVI